MTRKLKEYKIQSTGDVTSIEEYREAHWIQKWGGVTYDFRRWLYVGRPRLDEQGHGESLVHAGRDQLVETLRNAVWDIPNVTNKTKLGYCRNGLTFFFEYLDSRHGVMPITSLEQIHQTSLEDYIYWLRHIRQSKSRPGRPKSTSARLSEGSVKNHYHSLKAILQHLVHQRALPGGIFPPNPFPNSHRAINSHSPYLKQVLKKLLKALAKDIRELRAGQLALSSKEVLTIYLLFIAARSGRNPSPLMDASRDALQPHPLKPHSMMMLQLFKNRGNATSIQAYRYSKVVEDLISVPMDVVTLFHEIDKMTAPLVREAPAEMKDRLWLYRISRNKGAGTVTVLDNYLYLAKSIVARHGLTDIDGKPLKLNISRLRTTFTMRMWKKTGGDPLRTAKLAGNVPTVTDRHYLAPTPEMEANHRRLGHVMHADLSGALDNPDALAALSREVGVPPEQLVNIVSGKNNTGVGRCRDPLHGAMAPDDGNLCENWLACFRCPDQVVMESDMYRLYSFYYLLLKEKHFLQQERWEEIYGPIIHCIDNEIVAPNLRSLKNPKGCFDPLSVKREKERAERDPHPMWRCREMLVSGDYDE